MDRAFDCLNSKSKYGKEHKEAIKPDNIETAEEIYEQFSSYLLTLDDTSHSSIYTSRRKTFVVGFICTFKAVLLLANDLFKANIVSYFPTFRISQDFIETLFSKIRRMGGHNNNPTSSGFKSALRNLLTKQAISASKSANCFDSNDSSGLFRFEWSRRVAPHPDSETLESIPEDIYPKSLQGLDLIKENITNYVAGYIVRSLQGKLTCSECSQQLLSSDLPCFEHTYSAPQPSRTLLSVKNCGGLKLASDAVCKVIARCEQIISTYLTESLMTKSTVDRVLLSLFMRSVVEDQPVTFFTHHCPIEEGLTHHRDQLVRMIAVKYIDIRLKHYSRRYNRVVVEGSKSSDRSRLNRLIVFKHQ